MSSNLRATLPSVTLIFSLPRASVAVRVSQLHRGVVVYTGVQGHPTAAAEAAPPCGSQSLHTLETQDPGAKVKPASPHHHPVLLASLHWLALI